MYLGWTTFAYIYVPSKCSHGLFTVTVILSSQVVSLPFQSVIHGGCKLLCSNEHLDRSRWVTVIRDLTWLHTTIRIGTRFCLASSSSGSFMGFFSFRQFMLIQHSLYLFHHVPISAQQTGAVLNDHWWESNPSPLVLSIWADCLICICIHV